MRALVVGGSKGIGKASVELLLNQEYEVIVASRTNSDISHLPVEFLKMDVLGETSVLDDLGPLDALIYCPGSIVLKPFARMSEADFINDFQLNVLGAIKTVKSCITGLKEAKGSVVFFSTVAVQQGMPFHSSVASSKGAIEGLARSLAAEYAPDVRFNVIAPSLTDTPLAAQLLNHEKKREANEQRHPLKRIGTAEEIASMAVHLVGPSSKWITGQVIGIDGGMSRLR